MQHIITKYFGPGNVRGSRIKAKWSWGDHSTMLNIQPEWSVEQAHVEAAKALIKQRTGWHMAQYGNPGPCVGEQVMSAFGDNEAVHVFVDPDSTWTVGQDDGAITR